MNYSESLAYIESLSPTLEKPSLVRIAAFMDCHSNWQNQYEVIHVGGTNGKGSTVAIIDSIARAAGFRVGRFTGPHLLRWNERFHLDGRPISDDEFARVATLIREFSEDFGSENPELGPLTWFEYLTAIAFYWFAESKVDLAVIEVGLGGRFDATNIVRNVLTSVVTNVDLDHMHILGDTVEQIAFEKAGIIKSSVPVVTAASGKSLQVIVDKCAELGSALYVFPTTAQADLSQEIERDFHACKNSVALLGNFQEINGLLAVAAFHISGLPRKSKAETLNSIRRGFENAYWPGRLQMLEAQKLILDGAHNAAGALALRSALDGLFPDSNFQFVLGCFENKNAEQLIDALVRPGDRVYASQAATRRATYSKEQLTEFCSRRGVNAQPLPSIAAALYAAQAEQETGFIVATGSFATVREVIVALGWKTVEDGRPECVKISSSLKADVTKESI